jgi:hypothetical protein
VISSSSRTVARPKVADPEAYPRSRSWLSPWDGVPGRSFERLVEAFRFALEPSLGTSGFRFHGLQFLLATFGSPPFSPVVV